jgi:hypothetical protein
MMPQEIADSRPAVQQHWLRMIADGQTERFATMLALQQAPGVTGSDRTFMEGRNNQEWLDGLPKRQANYIIKEAKASGIDITGKYYMAGIADKRGWCDPKAWVSGRDDVLRVAKERNLEVSGSVNHKPVADLPTVKTDLNPRILRELTRKELSKNPSLTKRQAEELVKSKHVPRWKKKSKPA